MRRAELTPLSAPLCRPLCWLPASARSRSPPPRCALRRLLASSEKRRCASAANALHCPPHTPHSQLDARLQTLEALAQRRGRARAADAADAEDAGEEEEEREAWLLRLHSAIQRSPDLQRLWEKEAALLAHQRAGGGGPSSRPPPERLPQPRAAPRLLASPEELSAALAALVRPPDRQRLAAGVFRPGHILPTMTVEEFGEQELARLCAQQAKEREREAARAAAAEDRGSDEEEEERLAKARSWDDWKVRNAAGAAHACTSHARAQDDHPFGSGNSKLRPCG